MSKESEERNSSQENERKRKRNRGLKFKTFPSIPVRGLWDHATPEQQEKAHQAAAAVMEYWLGHSTKHEIAKRLGVPPLRIWQLSQQATSGMVAGLLTQPKMRASQIKAELENGVSVDQLKPDQDPKQLLKKIHALERTVEIQTKLIEILRDFPSQKGLRLPASEEKELQDRKAEIVSIATSPRQKRVAPAKPQSQGTGGRKRGRPPKNRAVEASEPTASEGTTADLSPGARHEGGRVYRE